MAQKKIITATFSVTVTLPEGANVKLGQDYVREAIKSHCGGCDPLDVMFKLNRDLVKVALDSTTTKYKVK
jgi:hypothetical protein